MGFARTDRSLLAAWWFTIDRALVGALLGLIAIGIVLSFATSPAIAVRKGLAPFYYAERHLVFALLGGVVMFATSLLEPRLVRRAAIALLPVMLAVMVWILFTGPEINGARRWLRIGAHSFQPSELAKPAFVVLTAWLLAEARRNAEMPALGIAMGLLATMVLLLVLQPDVGQTVLVLLVWGALLVASGQPLKWALGLAGIGVAGLGGAAYAFDHVRSRFMRFVHPASGDTYQTDRAVQSFAEGGFFGRGPGEGTIKAVLPDAHTDFIFAVIGEEYGVVSCLTLLGVFGFVVLRALARAAVEPDGFTRLAIIGLALLFALQAAINMGVNVGLLPAKGMTLPFVSAGGSSNLAVSLTVGMLLALMRRRADPAHVQKPALRPTLGAAGIQ